MSLLKNILFQTVLIFFAYYDSSMYYCKQHWSFLHEKTPKYIISNICGVFCMSRLKSSISNSIDFFYLLWPKNILFQTVLIFSAYYNSRTYYFKQYCRSGVAWCLCGSSSRWHGFVCGLWLWYFLIILTYYFLVFLLLLTFCLLLLPLWESVIVLCFVVRYFMSILVLQSSWWGRESWLFCLICILGVSWWLGGFSSRCHGVVCGLWLWYFLIILTYYFSAYQKPKTCYFKYLWRFLHIKAQNHYFKQYWFFLHTKISYASFLFKKHWSCLHSKSPKHIISKSIIL